MFKNFNIVSCASLWKYHCNLYIFFYYYQQFLHLINCMRLSESYSLMSLFISFLVYWEISHVMTWNLFVWYQTETSPALSSWMSLCFQIHSTFNTVSAQNLFQDVVISWYQQRDVFWLFALCNYCSWSYSFIVINYLQRSPRSCFHSI